MSSDEHAPPIEQVAARAGLDSARLEPVGRDGARVPWRPPERAAGRTRARTVLVTGATPASAGAGKTVTAIGLVDGLCREGHAAIATLRQPSLGPTLGRKGGGAGGGRSRAVPSRRLDLGWPGDGDAVAHAQNLLVAAADNLRFHGDPRGLGSRPLLQRRVCSLEDRALRRVSTSPRGAHGERVETGFDLLASSETMAVLALASDPADLRARLDRMIAVLDARDRPVTAADLEVSGAMAALLAGALNPLLVSTLEGSPVLFQAGPFANLGPGVSGVIADRVALASADWVVTEAGFGADLGAEKYLHLKVPAGGPWPDLAAVVVTLEGILSHGDGGDLAPGIANLSANLEILGRFGLPALVVLNRREDDDGALVAALRSALDGLGVPSVESRCYQDGATGAVEMARAVVAAAGREPSPPISLYRERDSLRDKVEAVAREVYGAAEVEWTGTSQRDLEIAESVGLGRMRPCVAKTPASLSADPEVRGRPRGFALPVREVRLWAGAGLAVPLAGEIPTLPGLPEEPEARFYDLDPVTAQAVYLKDA